MHKKSIKKMSSYHFLLVILAAIDGVYCCGITFIHYYEIQLVWKLGYFGCAYGLNFVKLWLPMLSFWLVGVIAYER